MKPHSQAARQGPAGAHVIAMPFVASPATVPVAGSDDVYLTDVRFTHMLSESFVVFAGKLDTLEGDPNTFAGGRSKTQFPNMAFVID